ncbi:hypothetical protein AMAG_01462 [Allomyces macrogynus ATCC 38327]|uniref:phosphoglucomutase (alpha-D-glucose-1,6-bisphosphate-dependent) n=1 Tax=Allomyces macrogynus (strain ATCC 38327) TaxID=578462 RepID=A0A0L0RZQ7_ALLM3|nr:hypothetical protein AMAG_01462 [Allomyces macrogynus ATCC 38327]|eukprot:KNE55571.1 hypothetical protein AMAG_01462 [Allomyces macrogynus ATCC 38327]
MAPTRRLVALDAPFTDQKPGTSGLRKRVKVFQQPHYTESFVAGILAAVPAPAAGASGHTLVVGGDGRYYGQEAAQLIIRMAAATEGKIAKIIVGHKAILSTPAASNLIRKRQAVGGILLTASHNPGGPNNDFGIKYNVSNGGPAPEGITNKIYDFTKTLKEYAIMEDLPEVDLSEIGTHQAGDLEVEVVDSVADYVELLHGIFDFAKLRAFFAARPDFKVLVDSMHGVTGPYALRIFGEELGLGAGAVMNATVLPDFGGGHPDPNLTYAHDLVERVWRDEIDFGAASDGDGDRNMIIGAHKTFVNPSDSVAVIAHWATEAIPYFKNGLHGVARSMPTSGALDRVATKHALTCYEVPTGWKFFGNLMDAQRLSICGEESFGTGSDHIREKDGIWAMMAWLSILAAFAEANPGAEVSLRAVLADFYAQYGRHYFARYDYEDVSSDGAKGMMAELRANLPAAGSLVLGNADMVVQESGDFSYTDPVDGSFTSGQGLYVRLENGSRFVFRLSGTGSQGATIRLYAEQYHASQVDLDPQQALGPLLRAALAVAKLQEYTGRDAPTVIT